MLLKYNFFQGFIFTLYTKDTDSMKGHAAQIFKVKTLLNYAFNIAPFRSALKAKFRISVRFLIVNYNGVSFGI